MEATERLSQLLKNDRFAALSNVELVSVSPGQAVAKLVLSAQHLNSIGTVMGGAIFTLADFAFAAASNSHGTVAVAINVSISFFKAVSNGVLLAEAREVSKNFKLGSYTVEVKTEQGELVALFQGMVYRKQDKLPD